MNRLLLISVLLICLSVSAASIGGHDKILDQVESYLKDSQPKKALKLLNQSISKNPGDLDLLVYRAEVHLFMGKKELATEALDMVLEMHDSHVRALLCKTKMLINGNSMDEATANIDRALKMDMDPPAKGGFLGMKGRIHLKNKEFQSAEEVLLEAFAIESGSTQIAADLATALSLNSKPEEALLVIEKSIGYNGLQLGILLKAGAICNSIGSYDDAISYLDLALTLNGQHPVALASLAEAYLQVGDMEAASRYLGQAFGHDDTSGLAFKIRGDYLFQMNETVRACQAYQQAIEAGYTEEYGPEEIEQAIEKACQ